MAAPSFVVDEYGRDLLIGAHNFVYALKASDGSLVWSDENPDSARTWPSVVTFFDDDEKLVIATAHDEGYVCSRNANGVRNFCVQPDSTNYEIRGLSAGKIYSGDDSYYILVTIGIDRRENLLYVIDLLGNTVLSRPRSEELDGRCTYPGNNGVSLRDLNGDGNLEIFLQCDNCHYLVMTSQGDMYPCKYLELRNESYWSEVCWSRIDEEVITDPYQVDYHPNFHRSAVTTLEHEGEILIAVTGYMLYYEGDFEEGTMGMFLVKTNKERFVDEEKGFDWSTGFMFDQPVNIDFSTMKTATPNIAAYDITGDGNPEFIFSGMDGYVHCLSMDKTEKNNWPIRIRTDDEWKGSSEVGIFYVGGTTLIIVFSSWGVKDESVYGYVHFVDSSGNEVIPKMSISADDDTVSYNGAAQAPTLFFNPSSGSENLFIAFQSMYTETVLFEVLESSDAEILWGMARGNPLRSGYTTSTFQVTVDGGGGGDVEEDGDESVFACVVLELIIFFLFFL